MQGWFAEDSNSKQGGMSDVPAHGRAHIRSPHPQEHTGAHIQADIQTYSHAQHTHAHMYARS